MNLFLENLENAMDSVQMSHVHCDGLEQSVFKINDLKNQLKEAEKELCENIDKMCADIAIEIRQFNPNLKVVIKTNGCEVHYRSKLLSCVVKPHEGCWDFDSTDFGKVFSKRNPNCHRLNCPISDLACAIAEHFRNSFRSLS